MWTSYIKNKCTIRTIYNGYFLTGHFGNVDTISQSGLTVNPTLKYSIEWELKKYYTAVYFDKHK